MIVSIALYPSPVVPPRLLTLPSLPLRYRAARLIYKIHWALAYVVDQEMESLLFEHAELGSHRLTLFAGRLSRPSRSLSFPFSLSSVLQETAFTAYHSPFQLHPALRSQPLPALTSSSGTGGFFSTINLDDRSLSEAALASFVVKRRVIDPKKKLCVYDSGAGKCVDASCKSVHFKEFIPSGAFSPSFSLVPSILRSALSCWFFS